MGFGWRGRGEGVAIFGVYKPAKLFCIIIHSLKWNTVLIIYFYHTDGNNIIISFMIYDA